MELTSETAAEKGCDQSNASSASTMVTTRGRPSARTATGRTRRSDGFVLAGELLHYWAPNVRSAFAGSFASIDDAAVGLDYDEWIASASLVWSPVQKLDIGIEIGYTNEDYENKRNDRKFGYDSWAGILRVERSF